MRLKSLPRDLSLIRHHELNLEGCHHCEALLASTHSLFLGSGIIETKSCSTAVLPQCGVSGIALSITQYS